MSNQKSVRALKIISFTIFFVFADKKNLLSIGSFGFGPSLK